MLNYLVRVITFYEVMFFSMMSMASIIGFNITKALRSLLSGHQSG